MALCAVLTPSRPHLPGEPAPWALLSPLGPVLRRNPSISYVIAALCWNFPEDPTQGLAPPRTVRLCKPPRLARHIWRSRDVGQDPKPGQHVFALLLCCPLMG